MVAFLVTILIFWLGWKLLRWWLMRKLNNRAQDFFDQFTRQTGQRQPGDAAGNNPPRRTSTGWDRPSHEKVIARDEGEYIDYEEITVSHTEINAETETTVEPDGTTTTRTSASVTEERITDVEWEDI